MAPATSSSSRPALTHFLALPLIPSSLSSPARAQLSRSLAAFRADVTSPSTGFAVPPDAVRPLGTLHLTLGVMALSANAPPGGGGSSLAEAVALLRSLRPREMLASLAAELEQQHNPAAISISSTTNNSGGARVDSAGKETENLRISLCGIQSMQQDASKASVLFARPKLTAPLPASPLLLQRFCERLASVFKDAGLMVIENRPLKLHATVVNTIYAKGKRTGSKGRGGGGRGGWKKERLTIDARGILERYEDYVWMEDAVLDKLVIYNMGAKKTVRVDEDGVEEEDAEYRVEVEVDM